MTAAPHGFVGRPPRRTLVLGWGNPGRLDDGLGPALARSIAARELPGVTVLTEYQLQVEHSWDVAQVDRVVFVDAARSGAAPFSLERVFPTSHAPGFTSHELAPGDLLSMAEDLFFATPEAWLLAVRGYRFDEFGEQLSGEARANLESAIEQLAELVLDAGPEGAWPADLPPDPSGRRQYPDVVPPAVEGVPAGRDADGVDGDARRTIETGAK